MPTDCNKKFKASPNEMYCGKHACSNAGRELRDSCDADDLKVAVELILGERDDNSRSQQLMGLWGQFDDMDQETKEKFTQALGNLQ